MPSVKQIFLITFLCTLSGIIFYGFYDEKIHIDYSIRPESTPPPSESPHSLTFFYSKNDTLTSITKTYSLTTLDNETVKNIINMWLAHCFEHAPKLQKTICHSLIIKNRIYYCSFTLTPFTTTTSLYEKYAFFEGLIHTLYNLEPSLKGIIFLINHKPFEDEDYDFSLPWSLQLFT